MKISELITALNKIKENSGDLPVRFTGYLDSWEDVMDIEADTGHDPCIMLLGENDVGRDYESWN